MRTPRPASMRCSLVTSAQPRRHCSSSLLAFQLRFLGPKPSAVRVAGGEQDVRMRVVRIVEVHADVGDHALANELAIGRSRGAARLFSL